MTKNGIGGTDGGSLIANSALSAVTIEDAQVLGLRERLAMAVDPRAWEKIEPVHVFDVYDAYRKKSLEHVDKVLAALESEMTPNVLRAGHYEMPWASPAVTRRIWQAMIAAIRKGN
jgi:hypothetical protein